VSAFSKIEAKKLKAATKNLCTHTNNKKKLKRKQGAVSQQEKESVFHFPTFSSKRRKWLEKLVTLYKFLHLRGKLDNDALTTS